MKKVFLSLFSLLLNLVAIFNPNLLPILKLFSFVRQIARFVDSIEKKMDEENEDEYCEESENDNTDC